MADFKLKVDESNKAAELPLLRICGTVQQNPHMRAFWGSVFSFFLAFLGWFALAPLGLEVATSINMCENQKFPPAENPLRPAYLKYKSLKTGLEYCQYGKVKDGDTITDCAAVPADIMSSATATAEEKSPYAPAVLAKCVCTTGTECNGMIANAGVAAVASTIFVRIALGTLLERFGPVNVQASLLTFGAFWVAMAAAISAPWNYTLGGVFGSGVLDAHLMLHADADDATYIAQDLHRFFDGVDWRLMEANLCWLRAPPQLVRLLHNFYRQGARVFAHAGMLSERFIRVSRGLLQGCPLSPLVAATFLKVWGHHVASASCKVTSFVDDRTIWAKGSGNHTLEVEQDLLSAYRRSNEFDEACAFSCRPEKCQLAAATPESLTVLPQATGYKVASELRCLGLVHDLREGVVLLGPQVLEEVRLRCRNLARLPCDLVQRAKLFRVLVQPVFLWAAGLVTYDIAFLKRLRSELVSVFARSWCVDTPLLVGLELLGWDCDPWMQCFLRTFTAACRYHTREPRWLETVGLDFAFKRWPQLFGGAQKCLAELGWWASPDGKDISRRDDSGIVRTFVVGYDSVKVLRSWIVDHARVLLAARSARVNGSRKRAPSPNLAQGLDVPRGPPRSRFLCQGHKRLFASATRRVETKAALTTGCNVWHFFPGYRLTEQDPRAVCICGNSMPSRPHLCWQCPGTEVVRQNIRFPDNCAEERMFSVALPELPAPPAASHYTDPVPELAELLRTSFAEGDTVYVATDGSEKEDVAAWALFLPAGGHRVARQCLGQDQTAFRAEVEAIRTCLLAVRYLAREGMQFRGKSLCLETDCQAAISLVSTGEASCVLLARELLQLRRDADRLLRVSLQWVPSHGKQSPDFQLQCEASEASLRHWNDVADRAANTARQVAAAACRRPHWHALCEQALQWEMKALEVLVKASDLYESHVTALKQTLAA